MPPRHESSQHLDPAIALSIRHECEQALAPVLAEVREINTRLGRGDTKLALIEQRLDTIESQPKTDRHRKREMNPLLMAVVSGALGAIGSTTAIWFLVGIGQTAAKGSP